MNQKVLKISKVKHKQLAKKYNGFINLVVDNWRGYRFIFDTVDTRKCKNNCINCALYKLVGIVKKDLFSAGLYKASKKDRELFGPQKYLNCKTLEQYQNCYINFIIKKIKTKKELKKELLLIKNFRLIFSKEHKNLKQAEKDLKKDIIKKVLKNSNPTKKKIIIEILNNTRFNNFYD